jgi:hypothetical protein
MRDPKRLDDFYDRMKKIHQEKLPDWRFGQLMLNFLSMYMANNESALFYIEDKELIRKLEEYVDSLFNK